jgi:hypothetical protein
MGSRWPIGEIWPGETVVIAATGPSFNARQARTIGMAKASGLCRVITVNDAVYPCWYADIAYAADPQWWEHHRGLPGFPGLKISLLAEGGRQSSLSPENDIWYVPSTGAEGFESSGDAIRTGGNSGYQALHLSMLLGVSRVVLVGFDMHDTDGQKHWFGEHPPAIARNRNPGRWRQRLAPLAEAAAERGLSILNASPKSALDAFPRVDLRHILGVLE